MDNLITVPEKAKGKKKMNSKIVKPHDIEEGAKGSPMKAKAKGAMQRVIKKIQKEKVGTDERRSNLQWPLHKLKSNTYNPETEERETVHHYIRSPNKHDALAKLQRSLHNEPHSGLKYLSIVKEEVENIDELSRRTMLSAYSSAISTSPKDPKSPQRQRLKDKLIKRFQNNPPSQEPSPLFGPARSGMRLNNEIEYDDNVVTELSVPEGTSGKRKKVFSSLVPIRMADGTINMLPPGKSGSSGH